MSHVVNPASLQYPNAVLHGSLFPSGPHRTGAALYVLPQRIRGRWRLCAPRSDSFTRGDAASPKSLWRFPIESVHLVGTGLPPCDEGIVGSLREPVKQKSTRL